MPQPLRTTLCASFLLLLCTAQSSFYVSPAGSDAAGDGSAANPFASLSRVQLAVRAAIPSLSSDINVIFRGGEYPINRSVIFTPADSPTAPFSVHYRAYAGEVPVLSAGVPMGGWRQVDAAANVWTAALDTSTPFTPRQFYVNSRRANESGLAVYMSAADTDILASGYLIRNKTLITRLMASRWGVQQAPSDIELLFTRGGCEWVEDRVRVDSWALSGDGATLNVTLAAGGWKMSRSKPYPVKYPTFAVGVLSGLGDVPGTGFVSSSSRSLWYAGHPGESLTSAIVPVLDGPIIELQGSRWAQPSPLWVHHLTFSGLTLRHATWTRPSVCGGYSADQSGIIWDCGDAAPFPSHATRALPAVGIAIHAARNISIAGCTFEHLGGTAVAADEGAQSVVIENSTFWDASCHAVRLGQVDDFAVATNGTDRDRWNAHFRVSNNVIVGVGAEYRDCSAVFVGNVLNYTIAQNYISNITWAGVTAGWGGWNGSPNRLSMGHGHIAGNRISYVNLVTADGGPIYVMGPQEQSVMERNYVSHAMHHAAMLYHDEGSAFWTTRNNVVHLPPWDIINGTGFPFVAVSMWACTEYNISVANVYSTLNVTHVCSDARRNLTVTNMTIVPVTYGGGPQQWPPEAQVIINAAGPV